MSKATDPYSQGLEEILNDVEFTARWSYVRPRLANILIKGQLTYAEGERSPEEVGQFTKFTLRILRLFDAMDATINAPKSPAKTRAKLHPLE